MTICMPHKLDAPLHWKEPCKIFACSMSDLFHPTVPNSFIGDIFDRIRKTPQHTYQILTKRVGRMADIANQLIKAHGAKHFKHVWWGCSISTQPEADKNIPLLLQIRNASVLYVSIEPMLEEIDLYKDVGGTLWMGGQRGHEGRHSHSSRHSDGTEGRMPHHHHDNRCEKGLDWVIVGGESGPKARPMHPDWVRSIRDQCQVAGVPFFFKQWGEWMDSRQYSPTQPNKLIDYKGINLGNGHTIYKVGKKKAGHLLDRKIHQEYPK